MRSIARKYANELSLWTAVFITCFLCYFLYSDMFGSYSDDQFFIALYHTGHAVTGMLDNARYFGRPLGFISMSTLYPLFHFGGLSLAYMGSCIVLTLESILVLIFFRIFLSTTQAFMLAIVYLLFPADTSKFMFINGLFAHISAILFWLSAILYAKNRPFLAALAAIITMLVYETHLAQALFIPLFVFILSQFCNRPQLWRKQLKPASIFLATFCISGSLLLAARLMIAPGRLPSTLPGGMIATVNRLLSAGWFGIQAVAGSHENRLTLFISNLSLQLCVLLTGLILVNLLLWRIWNEERGEEKVLKFGSRWQDKSWAGALLLAGLFLMYISYLPFALEPERWPPTPILRRMSSVHFGASVGYVLIWAGFFQLMHGIRRRSAVIVSGLVFLAYSVVMGGFFLIYQQLLVQNWNLQTTYWYQIEECLRRGQPKLIIVDNSEEEERAGKAEFIFDWTTPYVPYLIKHKFRPADEWPLVQTRALVEWKGQLLGDKLKLESLYTWYLFPTEAEISVADIMIVKPLAGALVRPPESFRLGTSTFFARQICYSASVNPK